MPEHSFKRSILRGCLNVNEGHNKELMDACKALKGYSIFVAKVRKYREEGIIRYNTSHSTPLNILADNSEIMKEIVSTAVNKAIDKCIEEDVLRSFFTEYREEVSKVAILEYSAERHLQYEKEDSYNSGYDSGYDSGYNSGYDTGFDNGQASGHSSGIKDTTALFSWLKKNNREPDILRAIDNQDYLAALFHEFSKIKQ